MSINYTIKHNTSTYTAQTPVESLDISNGTKTESITISSGQSTSETKTLHCNKKFALNNIVIGEKTLNCASKFILGDISIDYSDIWHVLISADEHGTVVSGTSGYYAIGDTIHLNCSADADYDFSEWQCNYGTGWTTLSNLQTYDYVVTGYDFQIRCTFVKRIDTPLCFTANTANSTVELYIDYYSSGPEGKAVDLPISNTAYSRDNITWTEFTLSAETTEGPIITLENAGDKVYFRNNITGDSEFDEYLSFYMTGSISASGNVNSMYDATNFSTLTTLTYTHCFYGLFSGCASLTSAPLLPATTVSSYCYQSMFQGCTSLKIPPALPATTLGTRCYEYMFYGCTSLEYVPELPTTSFTYMSYCYSYMFSGCSSLYISDTSTENARYSWTIPTSDTISYIQTQSEMFTGCLGTRSSDDFPYLSDNSKTYYTQNKPINSNNIFAIVVNASEHVHLSEDNPEIIHENGSATIHFTIDEGYKFDNNTSITNADYDFTTLYLGYLNLKNARGIVTVTLSVTEAEEYNVSYSLTNVTTDASNPSVVYEDNMATFKFTANSGYILDETLTIPQIGGGALYSWTVDNFNVGTLVVEAIYDSLEITLSALKTTTYLINSSPTIDYSMSVSQKFISNNTLFSTFETVYSEEGPGSIYYDSYSVYGGAFGWTDVVYITVSIIGEIEQALDIWLSENATQQ